jgi:tRNA G18 (ribose-2'-O)-methylase SpoU
MPEFSIESPEDRRLDPYRDVKRARDDSDETFIAEGEKLVLRLLESRCRTRSILCTPAACDRLPRGLPQEIPVFVASTPIISQLIGFKFHRGILACGERPEPANLQALLDAQAPPKPLLLVLCPEIRDPTNLGTIIRTAEAFGAACLVAGKAGTEPFSRRVLRTSMGSVLRLPIVQTDEWIATLETLRQHDVETIATVLDPDAERLADARRPLRVALLLGNEDAGIPANLVACARRRVTLPMAAGVDSLNVSVAAGIVLHHFAAAK